MLRVNVVAGGQMTYVIIVWSEWATRRNIFHNDAWEDTYHSSISIKQRPPYQSSHEFEKDLHRSDPCDCRRRLMS